MGKLSQKRLKIIKFFKNGYSIEEIAKKFNLDEFFVSNVIKTYMKKKIEGNNLNEIDLKITIKNKLKREVFQKMKEKYGFYKI